MNLRPLIQGMKGRYRIAQGNALGNRAKKVQALKGRNRMLRRCGELDQCAALSGLGWSLGLVPRALPWAIIYRPFGAENRVLENNGHVAEMGLFA
jgi:hypothetical protein